MCMCVCVYVCAVAVFMFDYVSTIISYSLVGVAIFSGKYDDLTPVELASAVSKVGGMWMSGWSHVCLACGMWWSHVCLA